MMTSRRPSTSGPPRRQIIMGIDPGSMITGWGVIESAGATIRHLAHGTIITTGAQDHAARLSRIYQGVRAALQDHQPDGVSLERVFFARNAESALKLGQARGVALLAAAHNGVNVHEYAASEIKLAVVGYGRATKDQVQRMVISLLAMPEKLAIDAADALAAAICHLHQQAFRSRILQAVPAWHEAGQRRSRS